MFRTSVIHAYNDRSTVCIPRCTPNSHYKLHRFDSIRFIPWPPKSCACPSPRTLRRTEQKSHFLKSLIKYSCRAVRTFGLCLRSSLLLLFDLGQPILFLLLRSFLHFLPLPFFLSLSSLLLGRPFGGGSLGSGLILCGFPIFDFVVLMVSTEP